jgi:hypothetical protein
MRELKILITCHTCLEKNLRDKLSGLQTYFYSFSEAVRHSVVNTNHDMTIEIEPEEDE